MRVILYSAVIDGNAKQLDRLINFLVPEENIEVCRTVASLATKLRQPRVETIITIILTTSSQELMHLLSIGDLLQDTRLFLVLPDRRADTIAKGHRLRPRFIAYSDNDLMESTDVLKKIFENATREDLSGNDQRQIKKEFIIQGGKGSKKRKSKNKRDFKYG